MKIFLIIVFTAVLAVVFWLAFQSVISDGGKVNLNTRAEWITLDEDWETICQMERNRKSLSLEKGGPEEPKLTAEEVKQLRSIIKKETAKQKRTRTKAYASKETETAGTVQNEKHPVHAAGEIIDG